MIARPLGPRTLVYSRHLATQAHAWRATRANQWANYGISPPLWLLSAASLFYSMKAFVVSMGERSTAVISARRWRQGVYQGDSWNGACEQCATEEVFMLAGALLMT